MYKGQGQGTREMYDIRLIITLLSKRQVFYGPLLFHVKQVGVDRMLETKKMIFTI